MQPESQSKKLKKSKKIEPDLVGSKRAENPSTSKELGMNEDLELPEINPVFAKTMMMFSGAMGAVENGSENEEE
jgi:hypothetical protein